MRIRQFVMPGPGHLSTLISDDASGVAAVIDPRRDVDVYLEAAADVCRRSSLGMFGPALRSKLTGIVTDKAARHRSVVSG